VGEPRLVASHPANHPFLALTEARRTDQESILVTTQTTPRTRTFNLDRGVMLFASLVLLTSAVLSATVSTWWLLLTAFVGINMMQASITGFCPAALFLKRLGLPSGCAFK
jgi:hypothetical protein